MNKIELHWDTRNEYVLTGNELKSLEEKHRRELERRKKEEEEKKKKLGAQVVDLQNHGGINQVFVSKVQSSKPNRDLLKKDDGLQINNKSLSKQKPVSGQNIFPKNNKL